MKKCLVMWLVVLSGFVGSMRAEQFPNQLQEIYNQKSHDKSCLELAYVLLLFSHQVEKTAFMPQHTVLANGMHQLAFIFENAYAGHNMLKRIKGCCGDGYTVSLHAQNKNLVLVITYDPKRIDVRAGNYTDLDLRKGFIIRFFDAHMLHHINNKESYVLQTAAMGIYQSMLPIRLLV